MQWLWSVARPGLVPSRILDSATTRFHFSVLLLLVSDRFHVFSDAVVHSTNLHGLNASEVLSLIFTACERNEPRTVIDVFRNRSFNINLSDKAFSAPFFCSRDLLVQGREQLTDGRLNIWPRVCCRLSPSERSEREPDEQRIFLVIFSFINGISAWS